MNAQNTWKKATVRLLIALLAAALVFTMIPLMMGKVFAEENDADYLKVTGDVEKELKYTSLEEMKKDEQIEKITKTKVSFHGVKDDEAATAADVTVDGVRIIDLISLAGLKKNEVLAYAQIHGHIVGPYDAAQLQAPDMEGNLPMFAWKVTGSKEYKAPMAVRGQATKDDANLDDWYTKVTKIEVMTLPKPAAPTLKASKKKVVIKWKDTNNADSYEVLRATKKKGTYKVIAEVDDDTQKLKFTDKKVKKGKTYFYKIRANAGPAFNDSAAKKIKVKK